MKTSKAQLEAVARYDANNVKRYTLKLNKNTDADILEYLENVENVNGFVKELIREKIKSLHE